MRATLVATLLLALAVAPSAHAAGWSRTVLFNAGHADVWEPIPRAAVAADGRGIVVWSVSPGRLMASFGDRRGRFGAPVTVARRTQSYAVAAADGGASAIAYEAADGIHVATREGKRFRDRRVATSTGREINGVAIAADPLGGWVVAERQFPRRGSGQPYRVRAFSLDARGRLAGAVQDLGLGQFGIDARPTQSLAVAPDGRALLVFQREAARGTQEPEPVVLATRPHGGVFGTPVALSAGLGDPRVTVAGAEALLTATQLSTCGDAGCAGAPRALRVAADGTAGAPFGPSLPSPNRAFAPWAAPTRAGAGAIVFLLKERPRPFSREAPVQAVAFAADGSVGPLQTLTRDRGTEPIALPLSGGRVLAVWATRAALGSALAGPTGRFAKIAAPAGPAPPPYHINPTNRDARSAGRYVIVTWARAGIVRVSVRRF